MTFYGDLEYREGQEVKVIDGIDKGVYKIISPNKPFFTCQNVKGMLKYVNVKNLVKL